MFWIWIVKAKLVFLGMTAADTFTMTIPIASLQTADDPKIPGGLDQTLNELVLLV